MRTLASVTSEVFSISYSVFVLGFHIPIASKGASLTFHPPSPSTAACDLLSSHLLQEGFGSGPRTAALFSGKSFGIMFSFGLPHGFPCGEGELFKAHICQRLRGGCLQKRGLCVGSEQTPGACHLPSPGPGP